LFLVPIGIAAIVQHYLTPAIVAPVWIIAILLSCAWAGFVFWRGVRLLKAASLRGDRRFDQRTKWGLASEYQASESATAAKRRRRAS